MSAIGPKQTWKRAVHMSAFGGKADMATPRASGRRTPLCYSLRYHPSRNNLGKAQLIVAAQRILKSAIARSRVAEYPRL
jgi:hypothetical protein